MKMTSVAFALFAMYSTTVSSAHAADDCKGVKVKEDQFGGGKTASATLQRIGQFTVVGIALEHNSGNNALLLQVKEAGAVDGVVQAGLEIPVRLENGDVLKLKTQDDATGTSYVAGTTILTTLSYKLPVSVEQIGQLAKSPITAMRIPIVSQGTTHDWKASGKVQKKSAAIAACFAGL